LSHWSVCQTEPRREAVAAQYLADGGFEIYLPRIVERERIVPLFPSYLFVRIVDRFHVIKNTIGITRLLLAGDRPAPIPDRIIMEIRARENPNGIVNLPKPYRIGDQVRILRGTFNGHLAIYDGMTARERERVLLAFMGRMVPLELEPRDISAV
jgi:transcriptional antiterminator RfaH